MIIVTGAAGFIGSCLVSFLLQQGHEVTAVDDFTKIAKEKNWRWKQQVTLIQRDAFFDRLKTTDTNPTCVIHLGARTDTTEFDEDIFDSLNLGYSKKLWHRCATHATPFIYASSAATYGGEEKNFHDDESQMPYLKPLNPYGRSKQLFDIWTLGQYQKPPFWVGLKFFNVYGPNEYHKGRMASVILHAYRTISSTGKMSLFRSHRPDFEDGQQSRDFIYVKDVLQVIEFFIRNYKKSELSGIYNLGTGQARSFYDLASAVFDALNIPPSISFIDTPADIRANYQYYTQAEMSKLRDAGYDKSFIGLEEGVADYVKEYLVAEKYL